MHYANLSPVAWQTATEMVAAAFSPEVSEGLQ